MTGLLILLRHGQSLWNEKNLFTGWTDVDLTHKGIQEAGHAARLLCESGIQLDIAFTSRLKRAVRTLWIVLDAMDQMWVPVERCWRLNERHYGALQGFSKDQMAQEKGEEQVFQWRRGYRVRPPSLSMDDPRHPASDPMYKDVEPALLPAAESLHDTLNRVLPCWHESIAPQVLQGKYTLVVAHHNSLRALIMHLEGLSEQVIARYNLPTGFPLIYHLDQRLQPVEKYFLGHPEELNAAAESVYRFPDRLRAVRLHPKQKPPKR